MAEVLSQSQIDALLNAAFSGEKDLSSPKEESPEKKYKKYDFYSPRKFTKDRIKMLNGIYDNYSRVLNTRINGLLHATCEVEVESVEEQRYHEFANALTEGSVLSVAYVELNGKQEEVPILIYTTPSIMVSMMDRMTGGNGLAGNDIPSDYSYTDLDLCLYQNLMEGFVSILAQSWESYIDLKFEFERVEANPTLVQLIGLEETVVLIDMAIQFSKCKGHMNMCFPGVVLANIFSEITKNSSRRRSKDDDQSDEIYTHLRDSTLEVVAELGSATLRLSDIYNLNIGDVIDLNRNKEAGVNVRIGGRRWFSGLMGVHNKHMAVKIQQVHHNVERRGEETTHEQ